MEKEDNLILGDSELLLKNSIKEIYNLQSTIEKVIYIFFYDKIMYIIATLIKCRHTFI